ncbi:hypothetical protein D2E25_0278 [Bifidobacterium goeldii]|uniref:Uncharacterized protein n=1 Tax=Bifidobacterium goeldii TaxID=2306975 RepID=A0A430FMK7_9BIFI|nr:hypothetical protein [Bifidobacterium goeldii]RSX53972.1 hypothetical protein D2E25_0278 [Bifidobacterium goeldii]
MSAKQHRPHYPYTQGLVLMILLVACLFWLLTHMACAHPVENAIAALVGFGFVPLRVLALITADMSD